MTRLAFGPFVRLKGVPMLDPVFDAPDRQEWDELDWERFLQRADARTAKYQELYETLAQHPNRDLLIAHEMGWEEELRRCGGERNCPACEDRFDCEAYELMRLMSDPQSLEEDPDAAELMACFEQLRDIPAYCRAQEFAAALEEKLRASVPRWANDEEARNAAFHAQMVPAQIAGGHGIGYERDSLCGNIANCKRALRSLDQCLDELAGLTARGLLGAPDLEQVRTQAASLVQEVTCWIDQLRGRIWWR